MLGISRESLDKLQKTVAASSADADFANTAADLLKVAVAISIETPLLVALVDSGKSVQARENLAREIFANQINQLALNLLIQSIHQRWVEEHDLVEALEALAAQIVFLAHPAEVDRIENEIFSFGRAVNTNPELQMALTNPAISATTKSSVVGDLLSGKTHAGTQALLQHLASNLRGRRVDVALKSLSDIAAAARNRVVAEVKVASALSADQADRLAKVLSRLSGKEVSLNVIIDTSVIGGVSVRLGDEVIDGTVRTRLDQARRVLVG